MTESLICQLFTDIMRTIQQDDTARNGTKHKKE